MMRAQKQSDQRATGASSGDTLNGVSEAPRYLSAPRRSSSALRLNTPPVSAPNPSKARAPPASQLNP